MRRTWLGTTAGLLCSLTITSSQAAERDTYQSARAAAAESKAKAEAAKKAEQGSWWWPFGSDKPAKDEDDAKTKADEKKEKPKAKEEAKPVPPPSLGRTGTLRSETETTAIMRIEKAKFDRRQEVCDRLREVAYETGDVQLEQQANLLEQRAWYVYEQRSRAARMPSLVPSDAPASLPQDKRVSTATNRKEEGRPVRSISARQRTENESED